MTEAAVSDVCGGGASTASYGVASTTACSHWQGGSLESRNYPSSPIHARARLPPEPRSGF